MVVEKYIIWCKNVALLSCFKFFIHSDEKYKNHWLCPEHLAQEELKLKKEAERRAEIKKAFDKREAEINGEVDT